MIHLTQREVLTAAESAGLERLHFGIDRKGRRIVYHYEAAAKNRLGRVKREGGRATA